MCTILNAATGEEVEGRVTVKAHGCTTNRAVATLTGGWGRFVRANGLQVRSGRCLPNEQEAHAGCAELHWRWQHGSAAPLLSL